MNLSIEQLWNDVEFFPNDSQRDAILHVDGPLFLPAGPGSGKTRVLLWRTVNLIVFEGAKPEDIFLSTFTEKAAFQLKQGLQTLLGLVTNKTNQPYDISGMYIGTVHSLCQRILTERKFSTGQVRRQRPVLLDALDQYFFMRRQLQPLLESVGGNYDTVNQFFGTNSESRHIAVSNAITLFNRFSEECIEPDTARSIASPEVVPVLDMYANYRTLLREGGTYRTDFSLLQKEALDIIDANPAVPEYFSYVIIDEYQDTNAIQEKIFFRLASNNSNLCVVGDDEQALYRFRGATVENFVEFPQRCVDFFGKEPTTIPLNTNYRSRKTVVDFYTSFIKYENWQRTDGGSYRLEGKNIQAHSDDRLPAVVATSPANRTDALGEIVELVKQLLDPTNPKVQDPSQIAFLFPSLKTVAVSAMKTQLEEAGFLVYAPRAGRFLEVQESVAMLGVIFNIFECPEQGEFRGRDLNDFFQWMGKATTAGSELIKADKNLKQFVADRRTEVQNSIRDYEILSKKAEQTGWDLDAAYDPATMKAPLAALPGLSVSARKSLGNGFFARIIQQRIENGNPFALKYIINSATALDWSILDIFYRLCGFEYFKRMFDIAELGEDEGPVSNLGLLSQYLARFTERYANVVTGSFLKGGGFQRTFHLTFLYSLFRLNESEYEDVDDPFPKGRIPFLTIHQAKGLEFPVVVVPTIGIKTRPAPPIEALVRPFVDRQGEPLDRIFRFDFMRLYYVALSRAENLLVIGNPTGAGTVTDRAFKDILEDLKPVRLPDFNVSSIPVAKHKDSDIPRSYSYTADYLQYDKCPRQYMVFRKYGFVPSRSQTQLFGTLVHSTLEDLHHLLIHKRKLTAGGVV